MARKRFRLGNTIINLGKVDNILTERTNFLTITATGCGCGINYSTLPPTTIACHYTVPITQLSPNCCILTPRTGGCGVNYSTLPPDTTLVMNPIEHSENIKTIKESLQNQLKEIEAYEQELEAQEKPQTLEEIDTLEQELQNSLKKVQQLKNELKK